MNVKMSNNPFVQFLGSSGLFSVGFRCLYSFTATVGLLMVDVHVQIFRNLRMIAFNSSSVADMNYQLFFCHTAVAPSDGVARCGPNPSHTP